MGTLEERERRLARARTASGIEVLLGGLALAIALFVLLVAPGQFWDSWSKTAIPGAVGVVIGFAWMIRIRFTGPEDDRRSNWRSH